MSQILGNTNLTNNVFSSDAENPNPTTYFEKDAVSISDITVKNYKFNGWFLNNTGSAITGWNAGTYSEDLALYAQWTYPDEVKGSGDTLGYAADVSLTYTITLTASKGNYSKTITANSGDSIDSFTFADVPAAAGANGVTWTTSVTAVNSEYGLKYTGTTSSTISGGKLNVTIPALSRVN